jgi:hypothetical protein
MCAMALVYRAVRGETIVAFFVFALFGIFNSMSVILTDINLFFK